jgi:hypothetical protein
VNDKKEKSFQTQAVKQHAKDNNKNAKGNFGKGERGKAICDTHLRETKLSPDSELMHAILLH